MNAWFKLLPMKTWTNLLFSIFLLLSSCRSIPEKNSDHLIDDAVENNLWRNNPHYDYLYKLKKDFPYTKNQTQTHLLARKGREVFFPMHAPSAESEDQFGLIIFDSIDGFDPTHGVDFYMNAAQIKEYLESTAERPPEQIKNLKASLIFSHSKYLISPFRSNVYLSTKKLDRPYFVAPPLTFLFYHEQSLSDCYRGEIAITLSRQSAAQREALEDLQKKVPHLAVVPATDGLVFCVSGYTLKHFRPGGAINAGELALWNKNREQNFYYLLKEATTPVTAKIPTLSFKLESTVVNGETKLTARYFGSLIGSCNSFCRSQGFKLLMDKRGTVLEFLENNLHFWNGLSEIKFADGDTKRLLYYANDEKILKEVYALLSKEGAEGYFYTTRMSEIYSGDKNASGGGFASGRAGSALATFFLVLAQVRAKLAQDYPNEKRNWPTYSVPENKN